MTKQHEDVTYSVEVCEDETTPPTPGLVIWVGDSPIGFENFGATPESTESAARKRVLARYPNAKEVSPKGVTDFLRTRDDSWTPVYNGTRYGTMECRNPTAHVEFDGPRGGYIEEQFRVRIHDCNEYEE